MSDDPELEALRQQRMAQMQQMQGGGGGGGPSAEQKEQMMEQQSQMKNSILQQVLDQDARARLSFIAAAKPQKAEQIERQLVGMARSGQIQQKLGEKQLKALLEQMTEPSASSKVKFDRRRAAFDSDEDED